MLPWDVDHVGALPREAVPFRAAQGITTPTTASGDNTVISVKIKPGYDGLITGLYFAYSGQGFEQGSGDILWRVQLTRRWVKDLSNVPFLLGSQQLPMPLTEGQVVLSGQTMRVVVNVPNLSGMIQIGASTVSAGLIGFLWPR